MTTSTKTTVLITGGNAGIGLATAKELAKTHGYHVIIGSRNAAAGVKEASALVAEGFSASSVQLDVTSEESIAAAASLVERDFGTLDVLINNAGILIDYIPGVTEEYKDLTTRELFDKTYATNVIGPACLTEAVLPLLRKAAVPRIVFVSSAMGSIEMSKDPTTPWYDMNCISYDSSKAAVNMLAVNYSRILKDVGAQVNAACPGLISSGLTNHLMGESTAVGAQRIVQLATSGKGGATATFSNKEGPVPW